jgi:integrase
VAREAERQRRRELEEKWNRIEKRKLPPTLIEASKLWLGKRAALTIGTRETYEAALKHVCAILGRMLVCEIEARDIIDYQRTRLADEAAGATINKEVYCLSSILSGYGVWEKLRRDVKGLDENEDVGRALSRHEETRLLECASNIGRHQGNWTPLYIVTVLGLNTGMRHKEIRTLRWKNLDLANRVLRVGESKTEAGKGRPIPLTQPTWAVLNMWLSRFPDRKPDHFVFRPPRMGGLTQRAPLPTGALLGDGLAATQIWLAYAFMTSGIRQPLSYWSKERRMWSWLIFWGGQQAQRHAWRSDMGTFGLTCDGKL